MHTRTHTHRHTHTTHTHTSLTPTQVILTQDVENVGREGELMTVPIGYLRNYLLPNGIARVASEGILE